MYKCRSTWIFCKEKLYFVLAVDTYFQVKENDLNKNAAVAIQIKGLLRDHSAISCCFKWELPVIIA